MSITVSDVSLHLPVGKHSDVGTEAYGQDPVYMPAIYNWSAPLGTRWNRTGLSASTNERMYHSTAILLPDSSVLVSGSNPNKWYPWFYNMARPTYTGVPSNISYGGASFDLVLPGVIDTASVESAKIVLIRGGFNTHAIGFGQRYLELSSTYTIDMTSSNTTLHVSQLPGTPGPTLFQPGPSMIFVVINGVPSVAEFVMVGSGQLGTQPTTTNAPLPSSQILQAKINTTSSSTSASGTATAAAVTSAKSSASAVVVPGISRIFMAVAWACVSAVGVSLVLS